METIKRKSGKVTYREKIYVNGKPVTECFVRKEDAKAWKSRMIAERNRARAVGCAPVRAITFAEFARLWQERKLGQMAPSSRTRYGSLIRIYLVPHLSSKALGEITREVVADLVGALSKRGRASACIDGVVCLLKTMLNDAVEWNNLGANPISKYPRQHKRMIREVFWNKDEAGVFLQAIKADPLYFLYLVALNTGMRRGELCGLRWKEVDFVRNTLEVCHIRDRYGARATTKTNKKRIINMNQEVRRALGGLYRARTCEYVFCDEKGRPIDPQHVYREFAQAQELAGMEKRIRFHDLRHSFAAIYLMSGGSIFTLKEFLGHSTVAMTERYSHLTQGHLAKEAERVCVTGEVGAG